MKIVKKHISTFIRRLRCRHKYAKNIALLQGWKKAKFLCYECGATFTRRVTCQPQEVVRSYYDECPACGYSEHDDFEDEYEDIESYDERTH